MKGIFEVHIITKPEYQTQLFAYITNLQRPGLINPRPTCAYALYGDHPQQPMLTFKMHGNLDKVENVVMEIREEMIKSMPILRIKIEAMAHNDGIVDADDVHYFEFHTKVPITSTKDWNQIVQLVTPYGCHLFYNPYNKSMTPMLTLRRYNCTLEGIEKDYEDMKLVLETHNFHPQAPEKEYSVLDTCVQLDHNWLFTHEPQQFITNHQEWMMIDV